jgi:hypothetical protein
VRSILIGRLAATFGAIAAAVGTFLPWLRSGTRRRNSYEIFSLVDRLGFSPSSLVGWGLRLWPILPLLLVGAVTLQWFPRRWASGMAAAVAAIYAGVVSAAVRTAPATSLITVEFGSLVTLLGAITLAAGALLILLTLLTRRARPLPNRQ